MAPILVVDDDESIREFIRLALVDEGYDVIEATHGADAIELVQRTAPVLILLDTRMPVMDGHEFAQAYQQMPGPHAPIVVLTAATDAREIAMQIEADEYLAKPFDLDDLVDIVNQHVPKQ